jgi:hypothetical protein
MNPVIDFPWEKTNVDGDTLVKTGGGVLHGVTFNGMTVVGDVILYDGIDNTGVIIATYNFRSAVHVSYQGITFLYDCKIDTGIFIDLDTGAFVGNLTVMWK